MEPPPDEIHGGHKALSNAVFLSSFAFLFVFSSSVIATQGAGIAAGQPNAVINTPDYSPHFIDFWLIALQIGGAAVWFIIKFAARLAVMLGTWKATGSLAPSYGSGAGAASTGETIESSLSSAGKWMDIFVESAAKVGMTFFLAHVWKRKAVLPETQNIADPAEMALQ